MRSNQRILQLISVAVWLSAVLLGSGIVGAADHPAFQPVKDLFAAMSEHEKMAMWLGSATGTRRRSDVVAGYARSCGSRVLLWSR